MATIEERVKDLNGQAIRAIEAGREILDRAASEKRANTTEELESINRTEDEVKRLYASRDALLASEEAKRELEQVNEAFRSAATPGERAAADHANRREQSDVESFFRRSIRGRGVGLDGLDAKAVNGLELDMTVPARYFDAVRAGLTMNELRVIQSDGGASGGSLTVPTTVASTIYAFMQASNAMRRISRIITTASGAPMKFPRVVTHGIGTQVASQTTAFAGSDPVLGSMTLDAYDYGQLVPIASDMIEDSGTDILGFVTENIGRALGRVTATAYVTGSGSGKPNGIVTAIVGSGTIVTGGSLLPLGSPGQEVNKLIDLQYSIADPYRSGASWLMNDSTAGTLRKLRDGAGGTIGAFLWQPSLTTGLIQGTPDRFLGSPVYTDSNVSSGGSDTTTVVYGDFSQGYYIRDVNNVRLERSDDLYFNLNQVAFRGLIRTDGDVIDSAAFNALRQVVA